MARQFNGSSQFIAYTEMLSSLGTSFTAGIWCNPDAVSGARRFMMGHKNNAGSVALFDMELFSDGKIRAVCQDDAGGITTVIDNHGTAVIAGVWQTCLMTRSGTTVEGYLNGVGSGGTTDVTLSTVSAQDFFDIGATNGSGGTRALEFDGGLAHAAVWSIALSQAEIDRYAAGVNPLQIRPDALVWYAPIWGVGSPEPTVFGAKNNGTLNAAPPRATTEPPVAPLKRRAIPIPHYNTNCVSGIVQENSVNVARTVRAYSRLTGAFLGETISDGGTGAYQICGIPSTDEVFVIAFDDAAGDSFNAQIFDKVIPVLAS